MKKRILLFVLLLTSGVATFGQRFNYGVHVGMNVSGYQGGDAYRIYDESAKVGAEIGGDISYRLTSHLLLLSGLNLSQYGGKFSVMSPYVGVTGVCLVKQVQPDYRHTDIAQRIYRIRQDSRRALSRAVNCLFPLE